MSAEAEEIQRIMRASVRYMLDAYRIRTAAGPVTEKALEEVIFRGSQGVLGSLRPFSREQRIALLPSIVRLLLATFLEQVVGADDSPLMR